METRTEICRDILYDFQDRWTVENIKKMTLKQYVSVGDKDTFCQWLETRTRELGSIKGLNSSKFGIYKRSDKTKKPKRLASDNEYSWQKYYSESDKSEAFKNVKEEIFKIIKLSQSGQFEKIDELHLTQFVKWKIAYLYSNERLIPIFKKDALVKIANHYGLKANYRTPISEIQRVMISNKPSQLSIYEYSEQLYEKFGGNKKNSSKRKSTKRNTRQGATGRNTGVQTRRGTSSYFASQKHNLLQETLFKKLVKIYGNKNVILEENYVDIKVTLKDKILLYEVKSSAYASDCIREALGQIISYSQREKDIRQKHLIVAGQYKPNEDENEFIDYVKKNLKISFTYENIDL
jgi:hypothetical protein